MAFSAVPQSIKDIVNGNAYGAWYPMDGSTTNLYDDVSDNANHMSVTGTVVEDDDSSVSNLGDRPHAWFGTTAGTHKFYTTHWARQQEPGWKFTISFWYYIKTGLGFDWNNNQDLIAQNRLEVTRVSGNYRLRYEDTGETNRNIDFTHVNDQWNHILFSHSNTGAGAYGTKLWYNGIEIGDQLGNNQIDFTDDFITIGRQATAMQELGMMLGYLAGQDDVDALYNNGDGTGWNASEASSGGNPSSLLLMIP